MYPPPYESDASRGPSFAASQPGSTSGLDLRFRRQKRESEDYDGYASPYRRGFYSPAASADWSDRPSREPWLGPAWSGYEDPEARFEGGSAQSMASVSELARAVSLNRSVSPTRHSGGVAPRRNHARC